MYIVYVYILCLLSLLYRPFNCLIIHDLTIPKTHLGNAKLSWAAPQSSPWTNIQGRGPTWCECLEPGDRIPYHCHGKSIWKCEKHWRWETMVKMELRPPANMALIWLWLDHGMQDMIKDGWANPPASAGGFAPSCMSWCHIQLQEQQAADIFF